MIKKTVVIIMTIGENIKKYREKKGLTQKELGAALGLAEITIRQYENNKREPKYERLYVIADVLNVSITDLMSKEAFNTAHNLSVNKSFDEYYYHKMEAFFSLSCYKLKKNNKSSFAIYETSSIDDKENMNLLLDGLSTFDLQDMAMWVDSYIKKVIECIVQMKNNPNYELQPYDPHLYPNDKNMNEQIKKSNEEIEDFKNNPKYKEQIEKISKYLSYTAYDAQKEIEERKKQ